MRTAVIVVPSYNESGSIERLIERIFDLAKKIKNWQLTILIVDSRSPDQTADLVKKLQKKYTGLHLLETEKEGLGQAYIRGFNYVLARLRPDVIFEMDADLSHDPKEIPKFLNKIEGGADFVIGSRYMNGGSIPKDWGLHRKLFSVLGNLIIRLGFMKLSINDWTSGYRAIRPWVIKSSLTDVKKYTGYVFQVALIDNALKNKARFAAVPINFVDRLHGQSKINSIQYIAQTLLYVFSHSSFIRYVLVGLTGASLDFGISYFLIEKARTVVWLATIISAGTAIISNFIFNNFWSFSHKRLESKTSVYVVNFIKFALVSLGALAIQTIGMSTATNFFGLKFWYIYKILILALIVIPYSYFFYNKFVWKDR